MEDLAVSILREEFGDACARLGQRLTRRRLSAREIDEPRALLFLSLKNLVERDANGKYSLRCQRVLSLLFGKHNVREACELIVKRKLSEDMRRLVSTLFDLSAVNHGEKKGNSARLETVAEAMNWPTEKLKNYLESLRKSHFVVGDYLFDANFALSLARTEFVHSTISAKYGIEAARIYSLLLHQGPLDQNELSERSLLPPKDARAKLYALFKDGIVALVENNHSLLWNVKKDNYSAQEDAYFAINNLLIARKRCEEDSTMTVDLAISRLCSQLVIFS